MKIGVIVRDGLLFAAMGQVFPHKSFYTHSEILNILDIKNKSFNYGEIYPTKYLFGYKHGDRHYQGLLSRYLDEDNVVCLFAESSVTSYLENILNCDLVDTQFASLPDAFPRLAARKGIFVRGWLPDSMADKFTQALFILDSHGHAKYIPNQIYIPKEIVHSGSLVSFCRKHLSSRYVILKTSHGAASRSGQTHEYLICRNRNLDIALSHYLNVCGQENNCTGIVLMEFIINDELQATRINNAVYKANCVSAGTGEKSQTVFVTRECQKITNRCDASLLDTKSYTRISEIFSGADFSTAAAGCYSDMLKSFQFPDSIFTIDFVVTSVGVPKILEVNKISGIFSDVFDNSGTTALESYISRPYNSIVAGSVEWLNCYEYKLSDWADSGFFDNVVYLGEEGIEFFRRPKKHEARNCVRPPLKNCKFDTRLRNIVIYPPS